MKSIFIVIPSFQIHGGIRVILEWANHLTRRYRVFLRPLKAGRCGWFPISPAVSVVWDDSLCHHCDLLLITSPHSIAYQKFLKPVRKVIFLQMMEHYFQPNNPRWQSLCEQLYTSALPIITISEWGIKSLTSDFDRIGPCYLVGNGVNLEHFPLTPHSPAPKDGKTVLVEGWIPGNATKDTSRIGPRVAKVLRDQGYKILAYSSEALTGAYADVPHEYYRAPSLTIMNQLYDRATILIKASQYDFRSCAPMEAMTKGTVTCRAIIKGDDDLVHGINCLKCPYDYNALLANANFLLQPSSRDVRSAMSANCIEYVKTFTWDYWMQRIERILWKD